jgi:POTRA domain, FtsQ-type
VTGLLVMLVCGGAIAWMVTSPTFAMVGGPESEVHLTYTDPGAVLTAAGLAGNPNVVLLRTAEIRRQMLAFPSIASADVRVVLPDRVIVSATERQPIFALQRPEATYLIAADGLVLASVDAAAPGRLELPLIEDDRTAFPPDVKVGGSLDGIDLAAMVQLGAVTPSLLDSSASTLGLAVDDEDGFVITAQPFGWQAIFGNYTPTLRPIDIIPRQVQCLRSLIGESEADLRTVYLTPLDDRCGTFLPRETPRTSPSPTPRS